MRFVASLVVTLLLLGIQVWLVNQANTPVAHTTLYYLKEDVRVGMPLGQEHVGSMEVVAKNLDDSWLRQESDIIGHYVKSSLRPGQIISKEDRASTVVQALGAAVPADRRRITLELRPHQANGWLLEEGDTIEVALLTEDQPGQTFQGQVLAILNEQLVVLSGAPWSSQPRYLQVTVEKEDALTILEKLRFSEVQILLP